MNEAQLRSLIGMVFGPGTRPVRRNVQLLVTLDPQGRPTIAPEAIEAFVLSPNGSIDHLCVKPDRFYHCGCSTESRVGGRCVELQCARISCAACFGRCEQCKKPLCLEHSYYFQAEGRPVRLCFSCFDSVTRRARLQQWQALLEKVGAP
jgi:hypothetical protein